MPEIEETVEIEDKVEAVLATVFDHYFNGMPEFAECEEPDTYAVYTLHEKPENHASGKYHAKKYWISVMIITLTYDRTLYRQTETAFVSSGFTYSGGTDVPGYESSNPYPHRYQYTQEFLISEDMEV